MTNDEPVYCPVQATGLSEWTEHQSHESGECYYCGKHTRLRIEPFGQQLSCKSCWEQICYGTED